jgi:hypothetical protein
MYISTSNVYEIVNAIEKLNVQKNETVIIFFAEQELPDIPLLISELNKRNIDFFGAIFPGIIYDSKRYYTGAIINTIPVIKKPILIRNVSKLSDKLEKQVHPFRNFENKSSTAIIIVDTMANNVSSFLYSFFNLFADSIEYLGCGAGFLDGYSRKCLFTPEGMFEDSAIITFIDMECNLGVHHGWKKAIGPLVVTKSNGKTIKELNWSNAFTVYKEAIETTTGELIAGKDMVEISKHYPLGIYIEGQEYLVREVMAPNEDGDLICAGDIPENAVLCILSSDEASLIQSAKKAVNDCFIEERKEFNHCFVIDCIGRSIFLGENFEKELGVIKDILENRDIQIIPEGVLSLGEIASMGKYMVEFLNKTVVIGLFHE